MASRAAKKAAAVVPVSWANDYAGKILSGEIVAGRYVRAVYEKHLEEQKDGDSPFFFDPAAGRRPIRFIEGFCRQAEGAIGAPIRLDLWQKAYIEMLFGWKKKADGMRRYTESMLEVGRKNGKTRKVGRPLGRPILPFGAKRGRPN